MERWASNTLRTLGIILTAGLVLITSLFLALLSMCAAQGGFSGVKHPEQVLPYAMSAVLVLVVGITFIVWLARGIVHSDTEALAMSGPGGIPEVSARVDVAHLSPPGRQALDRLVYAIAAQIVVSAAIWFIGQIRYWSGPRHYEPRMWAVIFLAPYVLYHIPYFMLIYALRARLDRRAFAYSLVVPAILALQTPVGLSLMGYYFVQHPVGFLLMFIPWAIHIAVLVFAYRAIQQVGVHPPPSSLIVAAVVMFFYFSSLHVFTPLLYRFVWR